MKFKILELSKARDVLERMDPPNDERPSLAGLETKAGVGELLSDAVIEDIRDKLEQLRLQYSDDRQAFDAEACVVIHQLLPSEPDLVSSDGFWRWMALGPLQQIVVWRFPPGKGRAAEEGAPMPKLTRENFGVGASARQRSECYPYKLWLRAELGKVEDDGDAYRFAQRGDVDFWTSHILRQTYTTNRALCAALVRFQFPDERKGKPRLLSGTEDIAKGRRGIRTLAKRIRRLQASCELSILDHTELEELLSELARDLTLAR